MSKASICSAAAAACLLIGAASAEAATTTIVYDDYNAKGYSDASWDQKWSMPYGRLQLDAGATRSFSGRKETVDATPFTIGADFSVFDHLKYIGVSNQAFTVPQDGSVTFSSKMAAETPGTVEGLTQLGAYGPAGTWWDPANPPAELDPYSSPTPLLEGQQAGVVMNMVDFCTGQLFDWFLSGTRAFTLIERLPTNVTGNTGNPTCPAGTNDDVGREQMYTQIIDEVKVKPGRDHDVAIRFSRGGPSSDRWSAVEYFLDGRLISRVERIGVPLDVQGVPYTGKYPSLGRGEDLTDQIGSFSLAHGLFSLLDEFPYQHPEAPELSVSIPLGTGDPADAGRARLFGQGARGSWDDFRITTTTP